MTPAIDSGVLARQCGEIAEKFRELLGVLGHAEGQSPGGFYQALFEAALKADHRNLHLIGEGFPIVFEAVSTFREGGVAELVEVAVAAEKVARSDREAT